MNERTMEKLSKKHSGATLTMEQRSHVIRAKLERGIVYAKMYRQQERIVQSSR